MHHFFQLLLPIFFSKKNFKHIRTFPISSKEIANVSFSLQIIASSRDMTHIKFMLSPSVLQSERCQTLGKSHIKISPTFLFFFCYSTSHIFSGTIGSKSSGGSTGFFRLYCGWKSNTNFILD